MPNSSAGHHLGATPAPPAPNATASSAEAVQSKRDLTSWWKNFKRATPQRVQQEEKGTFRVLSALRSDLSLVSHANLLVCRAAPQGIFGVPLQTSIRYANVAISLFNEQGQSYIYGYVPIVVAKCGVYLKEKATDVEGIFRLSGSEKRIKELRIAFDSPDRYGKGLDWSGYTVHDAANILRRYFNQLPEPIIPLEFYERFRDPLKNHQAQAVGSMDMQAPNIGHFDPVKAIFVYQSLITELPPLNRQLLLYILDLLAVFASKSEFNKMTTPNLAAIFQPGLLSHPQHDMAPPEYRLSQDVLIFLIENQDSFLIGMHGTAADEKTVKEVQSGAPSPKAPGSPLTPARSKTLLGRSSSNASAGADSVRMFGNLRRNVSVSSRASKRSAHPQGHTTPTLGSPANSGGIHRSNTVPSKHSASPHFRREKSSEPPTPSPGSGSSPLPTVIDTSTVAENSIAEEQTPVAPTPALAFPTSAPAPTVVSPAAFHPSHSVPLGPEIISASSSEATTPLATHGTETMGLLQREHTQSSTAPLHITSPTSDRRINPAERSPSGTPSRAIMDFLKPSPGGSDSERRDGRKPNKLQKKRIPGSALSSAHSSAHSLQQELESPSDYFTSPTTPVLDSRAQDYVSEHGNDRSDHAATHTSSRFMTPRRTETDATLRPTVSPAHSFHSTDVTDVTDASDVDHHEQFQSSAEKPEKKRRWRFSRPAEDREATDRARANSGFGNMNSADQSKSTISSSSVGQSRRSFQDSHVMSDPESLLSDSDNKKGPMSWIRSKLSERKEREAERRARSPIKVLKEEHNGSRQSLNAPAGTGKSFELSRQRSPAAVQRTVPETSTANVHGASPLATLGPQIPGQVDSNTAPVAVSETQTQVAQASGNAQPEFSEGTLPKQTQPFDPTPNAQA
ncbi:RhoGAP-domain-containing protein [Aureobasidium sp. EXF-3400]|nr:RhoGAP-domain-containing protein [Aureobasidium sp. EXF-12344]KAI4780867.1 RhoGAP-domain-containing protein [Aureobasidium sp. EXF-3400]